ncbi:hypothetical protein GM658_14275 [Pseudoduganella eburnea]|uniref:Uncharacterized protein n=1 Tax=Massilia eburnea TaxID=1776165 RepID=A0A6L6QHN9_9BURK|nr:hypothetical protein [Massilia eburnea]
MRLLTAVFSFLVGVNALADESRPSGPSKPTHSEYFVSVGAGVIQNREDPTSTFVIALAPNKPLPPNSTLLIEFENPSNPESPFVVVDKLDEKGELHARSPKVDRIYNKRAYLVRTKLIGEGQKILSIHDQWIWFELPKELRNGYATNIVD